MFSLSFYKEDARTQRYEPVMQNVKPLQQMSLSEA